jgi:hypothetical protein
VALGAAVVALCCFGTTAFVVVGVPLIHGRPNKTLFAQASTSPSAAPVPAKSPVAGDPPSVFQDWAQEKVREALAKQRTALLAGDETGYLAVLDTAIAAVEKTAVRRMYGSLRAMKVAEWTDQVGTATDKANGLWSLNVFSTACFVTKLCEKGEAESVTVWRVQGSTATLTSWKATDEAHPWQSTELIAAAGQRTVVATTKAYEGRLASLVAEADRAAIVADRFARKGKIPSRYVIYFAGPQEWKTWFGWDPPEWSGGVAIDVSDDRYELVLNGGQLHSTAVDDLLRHELTHASSLVGKMGNTSKLWWMIEGIAEFAEMDNLPVSSHGGIAEVRKLISSGTIKSIEVSGPGRKTAEDVVAGQYGIAFLSMRCLAERFTEEKMTTFFHAVVHAQKTLESASTEIFGQEWSVVGTECFNYVKQAAG